jgi:hypothetical protein
MDVRQATISVAVLGQADDGMPAGDQGRPRFRLEASCRAAHGPNESFLHPVPTPCRLPQSCNLCRGFPVGENFRLRCLPDLAAQNSTFARSTLCFPFFFSYGNRVLRLENGKCRVFPSLTASPQ